MFDESYEKLGEEFRVNSNIWDWQHKQTICNLAGGGFAIAWQSEKQDGSSGGIYAQVFKDTGEMIGNEFLGNNYTIGEQIMPKISGLVNGDFVITWVSNDGQDGDRAGIFAQIFNEQGDK